MFVRLKYTEADQGEKNTKKRKKMTVEKRIA